METELVFQIHLLCTHAMIGLIWFVQIVHYPMFDGVGSEQFTDYQIRHMRLTTYAVSPFMIGEFITLFWLFSIPEFFSNQLFLISAALFVLIWASTALLQVPCHNRLLKSFDPSVHRKLVTSNWIRTIAWSLRGMLLILMSQSSV